MDGLRRILDTSRKARMSQKIRAEPGRNLIDVLKNTDTRALAYLWIAVELNYNMVVFGKNGETDTTVSALSMLVPRYHAVLDISKDNNMGSRINFMKMVGRKTGKTRGLVGSIMPDRVIDRSADSLCFLFGCAKYGISFIASVNGDFRNVSIVRALRSGRFGIRPFDMNALDISIMLDSNSNISRITEYRWLEKAEISTIEKDFVPKSINNMSMMSNGQFDNDSVIRSKVVEAYAKSNFISSNCALKELEKRADFLKRVAAGDGARTDLVERYCEIAQSQRS